MMAEDVSERLYSCCLDIQRGMSGLVMPTTPLGIATRILYDILEASDLTEETIHSVALGQAVDYIVSSVRAVLHDGTWQSADLDKISADILHAVRLFLAAGHIDP